mgnify:CR=1 FL=1
MVDVKRESTHLGGAANVLANLLALGANHKTGWTWLVAATLVGGTLSLANDGGLRAEVVFPALV